MAECAFAYFYRKKGKVFTLPICGTLECYDSNIWQNTNESLYAPSLNSFLARTLVFNLISSH